MAMNLPEYPDRRCEDSPCHAHYFVPIVGVRAIWRCKYCWISQWFPDTWDDCMEFNYAIRALGLDKAYQRQLQCRPETVLILNKLEKIRLLRKVLPKKQLMMAIAAIVKEGGKYGNSE